MQHSQTNSFLVGRAAMEHVMNSVNEGIINMDVKQKRLGFAAKATTSLLVDAQHQKFMIGDKRYDDKITRRNRCQDLFEADSLRKDRLMPKANDLEPPRPEKSQYSPSIQRHKSKT
jgi:hypothetical protein